MLKILWRISPHGNAKAIRNAAQKARVALLLLTIVINYAFTQMEDILWIVIYLINIL